MAKPYLSVIVPAYNEANRLPLCLIDIDKHLSEQEYSYEIIVVNDGSKDATAEITERKRNLNADCLRVYYDKKHDKC